MLASRATRTHLSISVAMTRAKPSVDSGQGTNQVADSTEQLTDGVGDAVGQVSPELGDTVSETGESLSDIVRDLPDVKVGTDGVTIGK